MNKFLSKLAAAFAVVLGIALPASATTFSTDYTDLWWNPAENGWGINIVQQNNVIFATMYVYGTDNTPRWYVASDLRGSQTNYSGPLYRTTSGSAYSQPWNPAAYSGATSVGSMSLAFSGQNNAVLTYTIDGFTVQKAITRTSFVGNNLTGTYLGGLTAIGSQCAGVPNGAVLIMRDLTITHTGGNPVMRVDFNAPAGGATCTFTGPYTPTGKLGQILNGTWQCTGAANNGGTFTMTEITATTTGIGARFSGQDQLCHYEGFFGGVKDVL